MERQLSSFDIYVVVSELQELIGSYVEKIYQLTRDELLIRVNDSKTKQKVSVFLRNGDLLCVTNKQFKTPLKPTAFAMTLRKYLLNGKITAVTQHEFDRIINLKISKKEGEFILILEFFSEGNIILVNPKGEILAPLISQRWAHRTIKTHETYLPPPNQMNPFDLTFEQFADLLQKSETDLVRTLAVHMNLSGPYAEEICRRADVDKQTKIQELDRENMRNVFTALTTFLELFTNKEFHPVLVKQNGKPVDMLPFPFMSYKEQEFEERDTFVRGLQEFISVKKAKKQELTKAEKTIEKLQRQLQQQKKSVGELEKKIQQKKIEGEVIYLNFQQCNDLFDEITAVLKQKDKEYAVEKINQKTMVKEFDPDATTLVVVLPDTKGNTFEIMLDFRKSVAENAEKAYGESKKLRKKLRGAEESIKRTEEEIHAVKKRRPEEKEEKKEETGKTFWFERFRWFLSSDGNVVVAGKDAKTNEQVVKKYLRTGDRYTHADIHGAPSCVVKSNDAEGNELSISEKTLGEACQFAACYSKAWKQFGEVQAYWVLPEQVSKTPQSGEFLPKGAFVIRGKRNFCKCTLELAIGEIMIDGIRKIMGGPVDAVKKRAEKYVVFVPGNMKKKSVSHQLSKVFQVSTDQIDRVLPPGEVTITKTVGFELGVTKEERL